MESVIYKPYKRKLNEWSCLPKEARDEYGREIWQVEIGKQIRVDSDTGKEISEECITEDIYRDILQGVFANKESYSAQITLGYTPQLVIAYEGRLVVHNDMVSDYISQIIEAFQNMDRILEIKSLINMISHEKLGMKLSPDIRKLQKQVNSYCNTNYSPELIGMVLKEFICENERSFTDKQEELHYLSYEDLLDRAGRVLSNRVQDKGGNTFESDVLNEIFYRFVAGTMSEKV